MLGNEIDTLKLIVTTVSSWRETAQGADVEFIGGRFRFGTTEVVLQWNDVEDDWEVDTLPNAIGRLPAPPVAPPVTE